MCVPVKSKSNDLFVPGDSDNRISMGCCLSVCLLICLFACLFVPSVLFDVFCLFQVIVDERKEQIVQRILP